MANGDTFREIKSALEQDPNSLSIAMRDRLVLSGMIELYRKVEALEHNTTREIGPIKVFYKFGVFVGSAFLVILLGFLWAIFTGQVQVTFL